MPPSPLTGDLGGGEPAQLRMRPDGIVILPVQRQRLWDQIGELSNGGFLAHRNPKESEDEPEILHTAICQVCPIGADAGQTPW